ncbi:MAG: hypothetical protein ACI9MR_000274 [Myxococcota bacterium]|jgi:uncharacterized protein (TIGR02147 family)
MHRSQGLGSTKRIRSVCKKCLRPRWPGVYVAVVTDTRPDVFQTLDYRTYLRRYYEDRKANGRGFSYRAFSLRAGLRSPNYLKLVMDGDRNLTPEMAARFAKACGLKGQEASYFLDLVAFNQAKTADERNARYTKLTGFRRYRTAHKLDLAHASYHSNWYVPAIRELAARRDFRRDAAWVAASLRPSISRQEAEQALATLEELGLLVRDAEGRLRQGDAQVTTGAEVRSLHVANYHRTMMTRAAEAIDLVPSAERDISSLTLCLGPEGLQRLKQRIQAFRRELLELEGGDPVRQDVVQVNIQLFPLSAAGPIDEEVP